MARADKAVAERRVHDMLSIVLDGAQRWNVVEYVREQERIPQSVWFVGADGTPLSEAMIRRYLTKTYQRMESAHDTSRRKLFRRHLAKLNHLYARAISTSEWSTARAVLRDLAEMQRLQPNPLDAVVRQMAALEQKLAELEQGHPPDAAAASPVVPAPRLEASA